VDPIRLAPRPLATRLEQPVDRRRAEREQRLAVLGREPQPVAIERGQQGPQRGREQLATQPITHPPQPFEHRHHHAIVRDRPPGTPPGLGPTAQRANRRLPMTAQRPAVLLEDAALCLAIRREVPPADGRGVLLARWLGHDASFGVSASVTPVVRHQPRAR